MFRIQFLNFFYCKAERNPVLLQLRKPKLKQMTLFGAKMPYVAVFSVSSDLHGIGGLMLKFSYMKKIIHLGQMPNASLTLVLS